MFYEFDFAKHEGLYIPMFHLEEKIFKLIQKMLVKSPVNSLNSFFGYHHDR